MLCNIAMLHGQGFFEEFLRIVMMPRSSRRRAFRAPGGGQWNVCATLLRRQGDAEDRPFAGAGADSDLAAMGLDDAAHDGQAQPGPALFGGAEQRGEGAAALVFRHALAGVLELYQDVGRLRTGAGQAQGPRGNSQRAAGGHGLHRVEGEVEKSLGQLRGVGHDQRQVGGQTAHQFNALVAHFVPRQQPQVVQQLIEVSRHSSRYFPALFKTYTAPRETPATGFTWTGRFRNLATPP